MKKSKFLIFIVVIAIIFLIGPFLIIIISSFNKTSVMKFPPQGFSFQWYKKVFSVDMFKTTFWISLKIGFFATLTALIIGIPVAYLNVKYKYRGKNVVELIFSSPAIIPGLVIGFALLRYFIYIAEVPISVGLFLGHTAILFPYTVRVVSASLRNFDLSVEEAAVSLGSAPLGAFFRVVFPNIQAGVVAAFILAFITSFNNVPISLFLTGPGVSTLPIQMLVYMEYYYDPTISALSSLIIILTVIIVQTAEKALGISKYM